MSHVASGSVLAPPLLGLPAHAADKPAAPGHYLFAWAGDVSHKSNDFLAVIDADPDSVSYGQLITTAVTEQVSMQVHHTEYTMPEGGLLFANEHLAGRTFVFDVRDPLSPKVTLDRATGVLTMDTAFHDAGGKPGFSFNEREWPHGWKGSAIPHGVVFSR